MNEAERLEIFRAQTANVHEVQIAWKHVLRSLRSALRKNDLVVARVTTKLLAVLLCAHAEALFSKLIHTPYGFPLDQIDQVKENHAEHGIRSGWRKCVELGLSWVAQDTSKGSYIPNIKQALFRIIENHIFEPSILRNKLAHGQWRFALNRDNDSVNANVTAELMALDVIRIERWQVAQTRLSAVVESLIESPRRAFHTDHQTQLAKLEEELAIMSGWNLAERVRRLKKKPVAH